MSVMCVVSRVEFCVPLDSNMLQPLPPKQQPLQLHRVPMIIKVHRPIIRKQRFPVRIVQRVRVFSERTQDHQIRHVHHTNAQSGEELAEERGSGDDFESDFYTDTDEDDVGVDAFVGGAELPDGRAGDTMLE